MLRELNGPHFHPCSRVLHGWNGSDNRNLRKRDIDRLMQCGGNPNDETLCITRCCAFTEVCISERFYVLTFNIDVCMVSIGAHPHCIIDSNDSFMFFSPNRYIFPGAMVLEKDRSTGIRRLTEPDTGMSNSEESDD